jgi:hypothetical protein
MALFRVTSLEGGTPMRKVATSLLLLCALTSAPSLAASTLRHVAPEMPTALTLAWDQLLAVVVVTRQRPPQPIPTHTTAGGGCTDPDGKPIPGCKPTP